MVDAVTWNRDVFVRLRGSYRDCSRLAGKPEVNCRNQDNCCNQIFRQPSVKVNSVLHYPSHLA